MSGVHGDSARISPTAHYTAYVWHRHGLSHPALVTPFGAGLYWALRPANALLDSLGRPNLDGMLLARHRAIDEVLHRAIESGEVGQIFEVAAGFSPRGFQLARRHRGRGLRCVEADLPLQANAKRRLLGEAGLLGDNHCVVALDALSDDGPDSLHEVAARHLDAAVGTAIVTEGLLSYLDLDSVEGMWRRFARCLARFPTGIYVSDLNLAGDLDDLFMARAFRHVLGLFARGRVHFHYRDPVSAAAALDAAGFAAPRVWAPDEAAASSSAKRRPIVRILEAKRPRGGG